jgi:thiamine biosynthesis lipoprotein
MTSAGTCSLAAAVAMTTMLVTAHADQPEPNGALPRFEALQICMAVPVRITVYAPSEAIANPALAAAFARIRQLDRIFSHYDPDSELSRLCRNARPGQRLSVSPEICEVLAHAADVSRRSDGAFDVSVGPFLDLWRRSKRSGRLPPADELENARQRVGYEHIRLDVQARTVELAAPEMRLDLGAIAKGYATDEALRVLATFGLTRALVDAGGDLSVGEPPPGQTGWRIGIAPLEDPNAAPQKFLQFAHGGVATSGDSSQFLEIDGVRYSHIVNPRTGLGLTTHSSVTVVAPSGMAADSLASAVSVLGPDKGLRLIRELPHCSAWIVHQDAAETRTYAAGPAFCD